ncbi:MAG: helix-turn-helix transcriptional regulator [Alphaproteobacteria bacterium]|nr:helix-turn-helix transcriptional regulator [Alphaproteobacteria bacterium]
MESDQAISAFAALAQSTRLDIFRALVTAGPGGMAAGALAERLGVAPPTLSFHLKELARAGLAVQRREGRSILYSVDFAGTRALIDFLMRDCCQGDPRLCGMTVASGSTCVETCK